MDNHLGSHVESAYVGVDPCRSVPSYQEATTAKKL